jgi:HTH-type transcriptional regulator / antitoxin HigA
MLSATSGESNWSPNWATHPGDHLAEMIEDRGWSQAEFSRIADLSPKLVSTIISGKNRVSPETAIKLERVLGLKAYVWTGLQSNWDLFQARSEDVRSDNWREWLSNFPIKELKKRGQLPRTNDESVIFNELLTLLGIGSPDAYDAKIGSLAVQHRQSAAHSLSKHHIYTWLLLGERRARCQALPKFDRSAFQSAVSEIRKLTTKDPEDFEPQLKELCKQAGVAVVFEKPISQTGLFGSARWFDTDRAIIQMSLRMKTNDHFWWTFFHEAAHIMLHQGRNFFDDYSAKAERADAEIEADKWALEVLVGGDNLRRLLIERPRTRLAVCKAAENISVHPGIVVGVLQHHKVLKHSYLNDLKEKFELTESSDDC